MDSMPQNLRRLQEQLSAAIRTHRNLVGRTNLCPQDPTLQSKVQSAEKLIVRIYQAQKPLLEDYKRDCDRRRADTISGRGRYRDIKDRSRSLDDVLEDGLRHHFCPSTLDRWDNSMGGLSPEKKRKMNFLGLFDLVTPKLGHDIVESKGPHRKRRPQLVNADYQLLLGQSADPNAPAVGCKRFRTAAAASAAAAAAAAAKAESTSSAAKPGILTRSSRRGRSELKLATTLAPAATSGDKLAALNSDCRLQSDDADGDPDCRFCCAGCLRVIPTVPHRQTVNFCSACHCRRDSRASHAIGLPPAVSETAAPAAADADATTAISASSAPPPGKQSSDADYNTTTSAIDGAEASPPDSVSAAEMENKSLMQEAERWERNLLGQEQRRQLLVEKNCRAEKKIEGLLAQLSKVNGM